VTARGDLGGRIAVVVGASRGIGRGDSSRFPSFLGKPFWELPLEAWHELVDVIARSAYVASVHAVPLMIAAGGGLIVNVSSMGAEQYVANVAYGVGKAATDKLTRDMAHELADRNVAVVSLWPSRVRKGDAQPGEPPAETPRYQGRAVVALATDPDVMKRSGSRVWTSRLGRDYGFTDLDGTEHPSPD
jgi:dehydrogenase/reductase SDR family member 1